MVWILLGFAALLLLAVIAFWIMTQRGIVAIFRWNSRPRAGQIRVACVGDSITYGYGVQNWTKMQYPKQLGRMLGDEYCVQNFGVCGATASLAGDCPFEKTDAYRESTAFAPDLVLLMLGTNDSKPHNWKGSAAYTEDLKRLWTVYRALPSKPRVIVMTPPPAWGNPVPFDIDAKVIETEIRSAVLAWAETEGIPVIDLYAAFEGKPELLWDGVHPNGDGAAVIARTAATWIKKEKQG